MKFENDTELLTAFDNVANNYDYVRNMVSTKETILAARNRLRELLSASPVQTLGVLSAGELSVNLDKRSAYLGDMKLDLTPKEMKLLVYFIRHKNKLVPHKQLLKDVWGLGYADQVQYARLYVGQLRAKIGKEFIKSVPAEGYMLEAA